MKFGYRLLSCDSTGNKASSLAAYAARAGLESVEFCPKDPPIRKVTQAVFFGAKLIRVKGKCPCRAAVRLSLVQARYGIGLRFS